MAPITELNETHLQIMRFICKQQPTYILGQLKEGDPPEVEERIITSNQYTNDLVELGFLKDISDVARYDLEKLEESRGRKHRILTVTQQGLLFFDEVTHPTIN